MTRANRQTNSGDSSHLVKTKLCIIHAQGRCHYGSRCFFSHSEAELQTRPDLRKTSLCKTKFCSKGEVCPYAHSSAELVNKAALCKFFLNGHCSHQDRCRFAHGVSQLPLQSVSSSSSTADSEEDLMMDARVLVDLLTHLSLLSEAPNSDVLPSRMPLY